MVEPNDVMLQGTVCQLSFVFKIDDEVGAPTDSREQHDDLSEVFGRYLPGPGTNEPLYILCFVLDRVVYRRVRPDFEFGTAEY